MKPTDLEHAVNIEYSKKVGEVEVRARGTVVYRIPELLQLDKAA